MDVYEAIRARRTIRDFEDRQVGMGTIERIIDAGLKAPTNNHLRQWEFVIVNGKEESQHSLPGGEHDQPGRVRTNARFRRGGRGPAQHVS